MTHQALISSTPSSAFSPASHFLHAASSASLSSPSLSSHRSSSSFAAAAGSVMSSFAHPHHGSLVEKDGRMSSALRSSLRPYEAAEEMAAAAAAGTVAWGAAERGAGDGFSVEDLLDLEELCEVDKDGAGEQVEPAAATPVAVEKVKVKSSDSHGSSVVSYEPMPLLPPVMDLPAHDVEELEWVSRIMDDSLAELPVPQLPAAAALASCNNKPQHRRPLPQGGGALVPMRTPTICALSTEALVPVKSKKRSKRSRASVWSLSGAPMSDSVSSSSTATTSSCSSSASFSSFLQFVDFPALVASDLLDEQLPRSKKSKHGKNGGKQKPKKRGRKPKHQQPPHLAAAGGGALVSAPSDRRCSHCGVQKTPQWRAGPEGAKTLCNACGVRYKSGRLLPEYRPACSPTYVSSLHSNSHRKVLEMRRKKEGVIVAVAAAAAPAVASF